MRILTLLIAGALATACASGPGALVDQSVSAAGGQSKLEVVKSYHVGAEGSMGGAAFTTLAHYRAPGDLSWSMEMKGMKHDLWVVGDDVFVAAAGATPETAGPAYVQKGKARESLRHQAIVRDTLIRPDRLLADDVVLGNAHSVKIDGQNLPAVEARIGGSDPVTYVFDADTRLIRRVSYRAYSPDWAEVVSFVMDASDYQPVDGIQVARRVRSTIGDGDQQMTWEENVNDIRWNPDMPEWVFTIPETAPEISVSVRRFEAGQVVVHDYVGGYETIGIGLEKVKSWIESNNGKNLGSLSLLYRSPPNTEDWNKSVTRIQVPAQFDAMPAKGDIWIGKTAAFEFAFVPYSGPASNAHTMFGHVTTWIGESDYRVAGPMRILYTEMSEDGTCKAEVGCPVRATN
ncbi:MAG: hypothetical protein V3T86_07305 [Planctomycetota bacterium]